VPAGQRESGLTILHVLSWLNYGGVESYAIRLSRALRDRGHRVLIASSGGQLVPEVESSGIEHFTVDFTGGKTLPGLRALRRLLERERVDLVNAHNWRAGMVSSLACRLAGVPYLLTIHGTRSAMTRHTVFYWSERVIVVSEASRRNLVEGFGLPESRVVLSRIGVDCERFQPRPPDAALEAELGLSRGAPRVVHVSRFSQGKAPVAFALVAAMAALDAANPGVELILIGQGPEEGALAAAAEAINARLSRRAISWLGGRSDIPRLLGLGSVVVGTASVALEAMASGKPVIAAGKGGYIGPVTPSSLSRAEATCFADHEAMDPTTAERLCQDISSLLANGDTQKELGRFGRATTESRYSLPVVSEEVEGIYRRALCNRGAVRNILIFHLNQIGDLMFTLPALKALREAFPEARVTSILRPHLTGLVAHTGYVDDVVQRPPGGPSGAAALGRRLRRLRPDLAVVFSQSATMALCARLSGAAHRIGYVDSDLCRLLNHRIQERGIPCPSKVLHLVRGLGIEAAKTDYVGLARLAPEDDAAGERLLAERGLEGPGPLIALAPGESTDTPHKSWSTAGFRDLASQLLRHHRARLIVVGTEKDRMLGYHILSPIGMEGGNLAGRTTPARLAAVLSRCHLLIGIDSGPMHVAAAMGVPVVGLFGPTDPGRTGPMGEGHEVIYHPQPCGPCMTPTCSDRPCMSSIAVEEVVLAATRALARAALASGG
jgi:ADP-heptose:LPS heptosyltransferase/glycosyltransferase involved in cell wall biosynthesis